jgi:hypothetical protein
MADCGMKQPLLLYGSSLAGAAPPAPIVADGTIFNKIGADWPFLDRNFAQPAKIFAKPIDALWKACYKSASFVGSR